MKEPERRGLGVLLDVALEVDFDALWKETLTTDAAATAQDVTAIFRLHAGTKAKLLLPRALGWLVGPEGLGHGG